MARHVRHAILVLAVLALGALAFAPVAGAGDVPDAAPLTILKTVSGPVPTGTTFTVALECSDGAEIGDGGDGVTSATVTFDATGQPTSPDTFTFSDGPGLCVVNETVNGAAASTTYACEGSAPVLPPGSTTLPPVELESFSAQQVGPGDPVCPAAGPQTSAITVNIVDPDQEATVTVHNTFADPQPTPAPAAAVAVQPLFTG